MASPAWRLLETSVSELGEGPLWRARRRALWWVDILGRRVHCLLPESGRLFTWVAPEPVGFVAPVAGGGWIAGLKSGLHRFEPETGAFTLLHAIEDPELDNRLNDAFVDAAGRLWFGSMHDQRAARTGVLYSLDARGVVAHDRDYTITNGPCVSPDGGTFYHTDTARGLIYAFDLSEAGDLSGKRVFAEIAAADGTPDGSTVDVEGGVWVALWGGWGVRRYAPDGSITAFVELPVANVTKIAFGGDDMTTAYVTTAWADLTPDEREAQPLAGRVFAFEPGVAGQPWGEVRLG